MTIRNKLIGILLLITLGVLCAAPDAQGKTPLAKKKTAASEKTTTPAPQAGPALEPKAIEILKAASSRLAAAHTLKFTSIEFFESSSSHGHPLSMTTKSEVTLQRPDKLRVITSADGPASEFYYDGKKMMAYAPAENLVAVADAPPNIDAALEAAYHSAAIYFPFTDLIVADPYKDMAEGLTLAYYIGQSKVVADTTTDMVAYVDHGVFVQMWVGVEDKLPRLLHAVFLNDPEQLRHNLILSNWKLDEAIPADAFSSAKAASANPMPFAHPHPTPPPDSPPEKKKPAKSH
jgi:hypothetical protein